MTRFNALFPSPFTGKGDREAVEGGNPTVRFPLPSSLRADTFPVNGEGKGGALQL